MDRWKNKYDLLACFKYNIYICNIQHYNKHYMETLKIPDMVMGMLGVVPPDTIGTDDINGRIAYHKYLEEKYNGK